MNQKCFIFNGIFHCFSLVDIHIVTGLWVDGKSILGRIGKQKVLRMNDFEWKPSDDAFSKVKINWLLSTFLI